MKNIARIVRKPLIASATFVLVFAGFVVQGRPAAAAGTVEGGGNLQLGASTSPTSVPVFFECFAIAQDSATQARILPASQGGCQLKQNNIVIATAPGISMVGPVAATTNMVSINVTAGPLDVCWSVGATFVDGSDASATGCDDLVVP